MAGEEPPQLAQAFPDSAAAGAALAARAWTVAVAESCTGGLLGAALTAVPGSSRYVRGGVIAYHDHVKQALLAVDGDLLVRHGAVSKEVALAMARGARQRLETDVGVAITGVAGPGSESDGKAAGLVYVAVATPLAEQVVRLGGDRGREPNRAGAVAAALRLILDLV